MNCSEIQECLSAYHDRELSPDVAKYAAAHLEECSTCRAELATFQQISELSQELPDPPISAPRWSELQATLNPSAQAATSISQPVVQRIAQSFAGKIFALAATFLMAVGFWGAYKGWFSNEELQHHPPVNLAHYLDEFPERPDAAQQILLAKYDGRPVTLAEASDILGYEPVAAKGLPSGYSVKEVHLLKMPCCTCAQVLCTNKAGNSIAIFEHAIEQPVWFGDRPSKKCVCHDVPTEVKQIGNQYAAIWKEGSRFITIIGATDMDEISEFVAQFKATNSG